VEYDSVLSQQYISGEIVSLILCVWKPNPVTKGVVEMSIVLIFGTPIAQLIKNCENLRIMLA